MKQKDLLKRLIKSIGEKLDIPQQDDNWICQVVYSLAGKMALASLWDCCEDGASVSITHFKDRVSDIIDAYTSIYHEQIGSELAQGKKDLCDEIYTCYLRTGFFYHSPQKLSPAVLVTAKCGSLTLYRGSMPYSTLSMSGLGFYSTHSPDWSQASDDRNVADIFGLQKQSFESYLEALSEGEWTPINWPENTEFLRLAPPFTKGYWTNDEPCKDGVISLARYGNHKKIFVLYRYANGIYYNKAIPDWQLRDYASDDANSNGEYLRIAIALLKHRGTLPEIKAKECGKFVNVALGYRLPPSEENFFKLYSWPLVYNLSSGSSQGFKWQVFKRKMSKPIYTLFKHELESIGYHFMEEVK